MNIMDLFRASPAAAPAQQPAGPTQVAQPGQPLPGTQQTQQTANNGVVPTQQAEQPAGEPAPMAGFETIWQTPANAPADSDGTVFNNVDPQALMASASKQDFAKVITPEQLQAISAGGEGAMNAFAAAMNKVAQTVYAQSAFATTKIVDQALAKQQSNYDARLPSLVKKLSVNENLQASNPVFSNPALTPLVDALTQQLARKNPNASSAEIQTQVNDYFNAIGSSFAPKTPEVPGQRQQSAKKDEDWTAFFN